MANEKKIRNLLTGVKPTGSPHLGNLVGAIRPALALAENPAYQSHFFIADYHALTSIHDGKQFRELVYEIAATWLAFGLDPNRTLFYRQSRVPETFELLWILSCFTPKGLMNRAHAYKAAVAKNQESGNADVDAGIDMGLFCYPTLMAADILLFDSDIVPVGKDQVQHVEIARDIAGRFNQAYGNILTLPVHQISEDAATLPGLDGRKMSKSYQNTIPLFIESKKLQKLIYGIKTDSTPPEAPKDPDTSYIFQIFRHFSDATEQDALKTRYQTGIGWGDAKKALHEQIEKHLEEPRKLYAQWMTDRGALEAVLKAGETRARERAAKLMKKVKEAIGTI